MGNNSPRLHTPEERDKLSEVAIQISEEAASLQGNIQMYTSKFMPLYIKGSSERILEQLKQMNDHIEKESNFT